MKRIFTMLLAVFLVASVFLQMQPLAAYAEGEEVILFEGQASSTFRQWGDDWKEAVGLREDKFQYSYFTKPFTMKVEYDAPVEPMLVMMSWTGGPNWVQMTPSYTTNGAAYYTYELITDTYGSTDFSTLNAIQVMPSPSESALTVYKVSLIYGSDTQEDVMITYRGVSGRVMDRMHAGWNLGNTLDSRGDWIVQSTSATPTDFETAWGNPVTTKAMIEDIKAAGFDAVRVPVTWEQNMSADGTVNAAWMTRVKEVVDYVIDSDMICILNVHHDTGTDGWLHASESNYQRNHEKFSYLWQQIATEFASYGEELVFEGFNEMLDDSNNWSYPGPSAGDVINKYNQDFVDAVRSTGGNNSGRCLIVNTYAACTSAAQMDYFKIPADSAQDAIIVEVHFYQPWSYCNTITPSENQQRVWTEDGGKAAIDSVMMNLYMHYTSQGIPAIVGEISASAKENEADRADYAKYFTEQAQKYGVRCFWWDNGGKFEANPQVGYYNDMGLYNRYTHEIVFPQIAQAFTNVHTDYALADSGEPITQSSESAQTTDVSTETVKTDNGNAGNVETQVTSEISGAGDTSVTVDAGADQVNTASSASAVTEPAAANTGLIMGIGIVLGVLVSAAIVGAVIVIKSAKKK